MTVFSRQLTKLILLVNAVFGRLAQLVERYPYKVDVISSSLIATTIKK